MSVKAAQTPGSLALAGLRQSNRPTMEPQGMRGFNGPREVSLPTCGVKAPAGSRPSWPPESPDHTVAKACVSLSSASPGVWLPTHPMGQLVGLVELPHLLQHLVHGLGAGQLAVELDAHQVGHAVQQPRHLVQLLAGVLHAARPGVVDEEDAAGTGHRRCEAAVRAQPEGTGGGRGGGGPGLQPGPAPNSRLGFPSTSGPGWASGLC